MRIKKTNRTKLPNSYFSESFKRGVIEDYLRSGKTKQYILRKYNIKFQSALLAYVQNLSSEEKKTAITCQYN